MDKLTIKSQEALQEAQRLARQFSNQEMDGEHLLLALIGQSDSLVPELLQNAATPQALADALWKQLEDEPHKAMLRQRFTDMHHSLLRDTASESAQAVLNIIEQQQNKRSSSILRG